MPRVRRAYPCPLLGGGYIPSYLYLIPRYIPGYGTSKFFFALLLLLFILFAIYYLYS